MFKYRFELMGNPEYVTIHTTLRFHDGQYADKKHELLGLINGINGVESGCFDARLYRNHVVLPVGRAFDRLEVAAKVLDIIKLWAGEECEPSGPVIHPPRQSSYDDDAEFAHAD